MTKREIKTSNEVTQTADEKMQTETDSQTITKITKENNNKDKNSPWPQMMKMIRRDMARPIQRHGLKTARCDRSKLGKNLENFQKHAQTE